jgi:hypothetical protein
MEDWWTAVFRRHGVSADSDIDSGKKILTVGNCIVNDTLKTWGPRTDS